MADASVSNTFSGGTSALAADVNENFSDLVAFLNTTGVHVFQAGTVNATALAANAVSTAKIADDAVTAAKIADGAIDAAAKLADDVVTAAKVADGAIDAAAKMSDGVVTAAKLGSAAVTAPKLGLSAVGSMTKSGNHTMNHPTTSIVPVTGWTAGVETNTSYVDVDADNNQITAVVDGLYEISASLYLNVSNHTRRFYSNLIKNGATIIQNANASMVSTYSGLLVITFPTRVFSLSAGDDITIGLYVDSSGASNEAIAIESTLSFVQLKYIGPAS